MSEELKPCPFCGNEAIFTPVRDENGYHYVKCQHCFARGPVATLDPVVARSAWNRRPEPEEYVSTVEARLIAIEQHLDQHQFATWIRNLNTAYVEQMDGIASRLRSVEMNQADFEQHRGRTEEKIAALEVRIHWLETAWLDRDQAPPA